MDFRKRFSLKFLSEINELIIEIESKDNNSHKTNADSNDSSDNNNTIIIEATL